MNLYYGRRKNRICEKYGEEMPKNGGFLDFFRGSGAILYAWDRGRFIGNNAGNNKPVFHCLPLCFSREREMPESPVKAGTFEHFQWSEWGDLNARPLEPHSSKGCLISRRNGIEVTTG